jgi:hypothetical protein
MLTADGFSIDLAQLTAPGHVVLVDTDPNQLGEEGGAALGRLIIALIERISIARMPIKRKRDVLKPIWLYLDEAADYIGHDPKFIKILDKARSQLIGVTVAHQRLEQISTEVKAALEDCNIKTTCIRMPGKGKRGEFEVSAHQHPPIHFKDNQNISQVFRPMATRSNWPRMSSTANSPKRPSFLAGQVQRYKVPVPLVQLAKSMPHLPRTRRGSSSPSTIWSLTTRPSRPRDLIRLRPEHLASGTPAKA